MDLIDMTPEHRIAMMRKRHAYFTKLIAEHDIHTAREFCNKLGEMFEMFAVHIYCLDDGNGFISLNFEDYDYEDYTILDGENGALATISNVVGWKDPTYLCSDEVNIFEEQEERPHWYELYKKNKSRLINNAKK